MAEHIDTAMFEHPQSQSVPLRFIRKEQPIIGIGRARSSDIVKARHLGSAD